MCLVWTYSLLLNPGLAVAGVLYITSIIHMLCKCIRFWLNMITRIIYKTFFTFQGMVTHTKSTKPTKPRQLYRKETYQDKQKVIQILFYSISYNLNAKLNMNGWLLFNYNVFFSLWTLNCLGNCTHKIMHIVLYTRIPAYWLA